jgi:3-deoxy-D-manno-octulosonic-acid transferase
MYTFYNIFAQIAGILLYPIALFNKKISLFLNGRKQTFKKLQNIKKDDKVIWIHTASLGEFEQGRPLIETIRENPKFKNHKVVLSFFSPSGYEIRQNYQQADEVIYLPLDTKKNVKRFLSILHPEIAIFVKYEFWPNLLRELKLRKIPTIVVSAIFRENQLFFKSNFIGKFMRNALQAITWFFVQDNASKELLNSINLNNVSICSDTRFDRVHNIINQYNNIDKVSKIIQEDNRVLIAGSTWQKDEELLVNYINNLSDTNEKFILAPHTMDANNLQKLKNSIRKKVQFYSDAHIDKDTQVLIVDTIGLLSKIYAYATVAYVGGGFGAGIHNILEPATFGVPIIIGPKYEKFKEARDLIAQKGCFVIHNQEELNAILLRLKDSEFLNKAGKASATYVENNLGGTACVMKYLNNL